MSQVRQPALLCVTLLYCLREALLKQHSGHAMALYKAEVQQHVVLQKMPWRSSTPAASLCALGYMPGRAVRLCQYAVALLTWRQQWYHQLHCSVTTQDKRKVYTVGHLSHAVRHGG